MASIREQLQPKIEQPKQPQQPTDATASNVKFGGSTPERQQKTKDLLEKLFPGKSADEVAKVTGAPEGSKYTFNSYGDKLHINSNHPTYTSHRIIHTNPETGKPVVYNQRSDAVAGNTGLQHQRFKNAIDAATDLGVEKFTTTGSSDLHPITQKKDSGGYVQPRLGFNGNLDHAQFSALSPELQQKIDAAGPRDYHTLFKVGGGPELQQKHTGTGLLDFDLSPNSPHREAFNAYYNSKELQRLSNPATSGTGAATGSVSTGSNSLASSSSQSPQTINTSAAGTAGPEQTPTTEADAAAKRAQRSERIRNLGKFKRAVIKFARTTATNPLIAGTHLEHALNHIQRTAIKPETKAAALQATTAAPPHLTNQEHLAGNLTNLHKLLRSEGHPLANQYNWPRAAAGLHLDNAITHAADTIGRRYPKLTPLAARSQAFAEMFNHHIGDTEGTSPAAQDALDTIKANSGAEDDEIRNSLERVFYRNHMAKTDPQGSKIKSVAAYPDFADMAETTKTALRFSRPTASIDFNSALQRTNSRLGDALATVAHNIYTKLKLDPFKVKKAVHDDPESSTATTIHSVVHDDPDKVTAAAAHYGLLTETPSMAVFRQGEGNDSMHHFKVNGSGEKLRQQLNRFDIDQRVLVPTKNGYGVFILDKDSAKTPLIANVAKQLGAKLTTVKGMTEVIGNSKDIRADKESRRDYRNIIQEGNNA